MVTIRNQTVNILKNQHASTILIRGRQLYNIIMKKKKKKLKINYLYFFLILRYNILSILLPISESSNDII